MWYVIPLFIRIIRLTYWFTVMSYCLWFWYHTMPVHPRVSSLGWHFGHETCAVMLTMHVCVIWPETYEKTPEITGIEIKLHTKKEEILLNWIYYEDVTRFFPLLTTVRGFQCRKYAHIAIVKCATCTIVYVELLP